MAAILQHIPHMDGVTSPASAAFDSLAELLAIPWVAEYRDPQRWSAFGAFCRYSIRAGDKWHGQQLVVEYNKGRS